MGISLGSWHLSQMISKPTVIAVATSRQHLQWQIITSISLVAASQSRPSRHTSRTLDQRVEQNSFEIWERITVPSHPGHPPVSRWDHPLSCHTRAPGPGRDTTLMSRHTSYTPVKFPLHVHYQTVTRAYLPSYTDGEINSRGLTSTDQGQNVCHTAASVTIGCGGQTFIFIELWLWPSQLAGLPPRSVKLGWVTISNDAVYNIFFYLFKSVL